MNKQLKKLTLNKETLRDLTAQNAGEVKGGAKTRGNNCVTLGYKATACGPGCPQPATYAYPCTIPPY